MARREHRGAGSHSTLKTQAVSTAEARRLIAIIEKSQIPFGESAPIFARIKSEVDAGKQLSIEDHEHLLSLVKKAREWEKAVASSAMTEPEETLPG